MKISKKIALPFNRRQTTGERILASVALTLIRWPWYVNLTSRLKKCTKKNILCQGFQKLEHHKQTRRQMRPNGFQTFRTLTYSYPGVSYPRRL